MIKTFEILSSTNDYLKEHLDEFSHGDVVWAKAQTNGRGRRGKTWLSENKKSLTFSILIQPTKSQESWANISQIAALSICLLLEEYGITPSLKWPNDILIKHKKICGMLTEVKFLSDMSARLILGIGLNIYSDKEFLSKIDQPSCSIFSVLQENKKEVGRVFNIELVLDRFLEIFWENYKDFCEKGFLLFLPLLKKYLTFKGEFVTHRFGNQETLVKILDIAPNGGLEVLDNNEKKVINWGEILF